MLWYPRRFVFKVRDLCALCSQPSAHMVKPYLAQSPLKSNTTTLLGKRPVFIPYRHHLNIQNPDQTLANFFLHHLFLVNYKNEFCSNFFITVLISTYLPHLFGVPADFGLFFENRKGPFSPVRWDQEFYWYERVEKRSHRSRNLAQNATETRARLPLKGTSAVLCFDSQKTHILCSRWEHQAHFHKRGNVTEL